MRVRELTFQSMQFQLLALILFFICGGWGGGHSELKGHRIVGGQ